MKVRRQNQGGQALVLVLLALAVVLTIVLFILSRSITDISVSSTESQSISAFSAAEAGVEQALVIGSAPSGATTIGEAGASYTANVTNVAQGLTNFVYPVDLNSGDTMTLWFKSQDASPDFSGNTVTVCWGKPGTANNTATTPAIEVAVYYETSLNDASTVMIYRLTADPNTTRAASNDFSAAGGSCSVGGQTLAFQATINNLLSLGHLQFATVRMFYNSDTPQPVGFDGHGSIFPTQGKTIDSAGTAGASTRRVDVFQGWSEVPDVFLYPIYSPVGLTK